LDIEKQENQTNLKQYKLEEVAEEPETKNNIKIKKKLAYDVVDESEFFKD